MHSECGWKGVSFGPRGPGGETYIGAPICSEHKGPSMPHLLGSHGIFYQSVALAFPTLARGYLCYSSTSKC